MNKIKDFYQLDTWKESHKLVTLIYQLIKEFPAHEKYGLISQISRTAGSITANIAEGFGYFHYANKIRFYSQAKGSLKEIQNFILIAKDLNYWSSSTAKKLWQQTKSCEKLINGLIRSTRKLETGD
jgi:four helix bundle protein